MKKIWLIVAGVIAIIMAGIYIYIATIDWNKHKDKIAEQFSSVTGKNVVFDGPISFRLLPSPYLTASDIKVYNSKGHYQNEPMATVQQMIVKLGLFQLINGGFKVERMSLVNPEVTFEVMEDGSINWQNEQVYDDTFTIQDVDVSLDSVTIERAKVNFLYPAREIDYVLENLNAEVIAENIAGPYRIEGSYIKDNNPEGFAISLGQFSESFATSVNMVLNQPAYETYLRFDGTVLFKTDTVEGNVVFESNKLADFVNANFKKYHVNKECDYPLTVSMEVKTSSTKIDLNNLVIKYGSTLGAGGLSIPIQEKNQYGYDTEGEDVRKKIELGFKMTEFDMSPVIHMIRMFLDKYNQDKAVFSTDLGFDLVADIHSVKADYNNQTVRDLDLSFDVLENEVKIHEFKAVFPGETAWNMKGSLFSFNDAFTYGMEHSFTANNISKFLGWIGYKLPNEGEFNYKKANSSFNMEGNLQNVKIKPFNLNIDKTVVNGDVGIVTGERHNFLLMLNLDSVNFDNYVKPLPQAELTKELAERMAYRFSKLDFFNKFDARGYIRLGLGIYDNTPFENTVMDFNLDKGILDIQEIKFGNIANSTANLKGIVKGFGSRPEFENLKYEIDGPDVTSVLNKFGITPPNINFKDLKAYSSKGIVTGGFERAAVKTVSKLGNVENVFSGEIARRDGDLYLNGDLELRAPDFVKFVNDLNYKYSPTVFTLGLFTLKTKFVGSLDKFKATALNMNIGTNNFQGAVIFDGTSGRNNLVANLVINKFELDRFFYNPVVVRADSKASFKPTFSERGDFLSKPYFDKDKINYSFLSGFDFKGKMQINRLSYKDNILRDTGFDLQLLNSELQLTNFKGENENGEIAGNVTLIASANPQIKGDVVVKNREIREMSWSGNRYGLTEGKFGANIGFYADANSVDEIVSTMNAKVNFEIRSPVVKGWNLEAIYNDLNKRDKSDGFITLAYDALQEAETEFDKLSGLMEVSKGSYVLSGAKFEAEDVVINVASSGSIINWDTNTKFDLSFSDLAKVPALSYSFVGPLASPKLTVDAAAIISSYDNYWAKVAQDKKAQEEMRQEALNNLMEEQQQKAFDLRADIYKDLKPDYDVKSRLAENKEMIAIYNEIGVDIERTLAGIEEIFAQALVKDFDEKFIQELDKKNLMLATETEAIKNRIEKAYLQDTKYRVNDDFNKIVGVYNISRSKTTEYRDRYADYSRRLASIRTGYVLEKDEYVKEAREKIEETVLSVDEVASQARKDYVVIQMVSDLSELEGHALVIRNLLKQANDSIDSLDEQLADMYAYLDGKIESEEEAYNKKQEEEEVIRKLEENTGKISTSSGKDITVKRGIEDIQKAEEATSKDGVKVLDFSKPSSGAASVSTRKSSISVKSPQDEEKAVKQLEEQTGFVREITGEPLQTGGVIKKKQ